MLEFLTKSKIRKKIILLFIYNPDKEYYLSEIAKAVETSVGTAQRELNKLLEKDFVKFNKKTGSSLYLLNKEFALLDEVRSIIRKTIGVEVELKRELSKIKGVSFAFIFGSYAKKGFKADSDIDVFIIGRVNEVVVFKSIQKVEKIINRIINYHIVEQRDFIKKLKTSSFYKDIMREYVLLVGDTNEFKKIIR